MNMRTTPRRSPIARAGIGAAVAVAALVGSLLTPLAATSATTPLPDGLTQETAAGSCWEIKQNYPASADGVYWLVTPKLVAPAQFYCDQTTDGGGWVLVGRGREGWQEGYNGIRSSEQLRNNITGTAAFTPVQLPSETVDGLLNSGRVDALDDGIRLRRASNTAGTQWQESRFKMQKRDRWVWTFAAAHRITSYSFNGSGANSTQQTNNFGNDNNLRRVTFTERQSHSWSKGWSYGSSQGGSADAASYMWAPSGQGYAIPFTQVWLRPKLKVASMDFGTIPATGAAATTVKAMPSTYAATTTWGVSGLANGRGGELNTEVAAFGEAGGKVYVGGNFRYVQRTQAGADQVQQPYLAAFDVNTGQWVPSFRPNLNGQVKAIVALPDGRIAVGGEFSSVGGVPQTGIAFLDPQTGNPSGAQVIAENRTSGGVAFIRGLDVRNGYLYVSGAFTHLSTANGSNGAYTWNGGRINLTTGLPDANWNAYLNGTSVAVTAAEQGDRTYYSGYFKQKVSSTNPGVTYTTTSAAALDTAPGAEPVLPLWTPTFSSSGAIFQFGVAEAGGKVWLGGSEHSLFQYDRNNFQLQRGSITLNGGDFQTVETDGSIIVGGCHCGNWVYQDSYTWSSPGTSWTQADKINVVGLWDVATGDYIPQWSPTVNTRGGFGAWGSMIDSTGTLWVGGDFSRSVRAGEVPQWSGGFIRYAKQDSTAPTTPGAISATPADNGTKSVLNWEASTDSGGVTYEVLRDNRVIASTTARTYTVPVTDTATNYFVRARDAQGNRSATTAAFVVEPAPASALTLIDNGETWSWRYTSDALAADWNAPGFDASSWNSGKGLFARGVAGATTNIDPTNLATKPLSAQFRHTFQVQDALTVANGKISVIANDGVVLYLNGTELGRVRLPAGNVTQNTYANGLVNHATAAGSRVIFDVPQGVLVDGANVLAASVHANYRSTADLSFDLAFTAERGAAPAPPQPVTALTATSALDSVTLTWTAPTGGLAPTSYVISRGGQDIGTTDAATLTFTESGLTPSTAYEYTVKAVGIGGQSAAATVQATTTDPPEDHELPVTIDNGAAWSWKYSADALAVDWNTVAFDDSAWSTGSGVLARGVSGAATNIDPTNLATKPLSAQFRHEFDVEDASSVVDGTLTVIADDGVVVYLNGVELGRSNLGTGTITMNSYATAAPRYATASANRVTFAVPASLLVDGANVLSASVHANYRGTADLSFDAALSMLRG